MRLENSKNEKYIWRKYICRRIILKLVTRYMNFWYKLYISWKYFSAWISRKTTHLWFFCNKHFQFTKKILSISLKIIIQNLDTFHSNIRTTNKHSQTIMAPAYALPKGKIRSSDCQNKKLFHVVMYINCFSQGRNHNQRPAIRIIILQLPRKITITI